MDRRFFLKNTGLLAGGLLLGDITAYARKEADVVRIGIVGCGDRGKGIIQIINEMSDKFTVVAVCDVLDFRLTGAQKLSKTGSVKLYKDHRNLLEDNTVDAIVIALPLNMHHPVAIDVLNADKHLYLEKNMTYDISQALDLVKLVKNKPKKVVQIGHQYRYSPLYYGVKAMINQGYLGKISQIDCRWDRNGNWRRPVSDKNLERQINWRMYREYSGGLVAELLSHQIDFINWAFDTQPYEFQGAGGIDLYKDGRETFDNVQVIMRYPDLGIIGNFGATCGNSRDGYLFRIKGTKGTVSLSIDQGIFYPEKGSVNGKDLVDGVTGATRITLNKDGGTTILPMPTKDGTLYALNDFFNKIASGKLPDSNVYTGARTSICVHLANQALYNKEIVHWKDDYSEGLKQSII
jgi:predicted dehydrogenase